MKTFTGSIVIKLCLPLLIVFMTFSDTIAGKSDISVIITDLAYSEIWEKVTKKLEIFPIIEKNKEEGIIKSGKISLQPLGIFGVKYLKEEQIFQIQLEILKPKITKITVKIILSRLQKNGDWIDVVETSDYEKALLEYITEYRNVQN